MTDEALRGEFEAVIDELDRIAERTPEGGYTGCVGLAWDVVKRIAEARGKDAERLDFFRAGGQVDNDRHGWEAWKDNEIPTGTSLHSTMEQAIDAAMGEG